MLPTSTLFGAWWRLFWGATSVKSKIFNKPPVNLLSFSTFTLLICHFIRRSVKYFVNFFHQISRDF